MKDANIVNLFKHKGDISDCANYRGIAGKIMARVMLNRLILHISEKNLPESQCGFRSNRSTIDMVFTIRQIQEKCREQNMNLYMMFVDLTKAFDTVNRTALWNFLTKFGCPEKFVRVARELHDNMMGRVIVEGGYTFPFPITTGVKQGCVLAPTLFGLFFALPGQLL